MMLQPSHNLCSGEILLYLSHHLILGWNFCIHFQVYYQKRFYGSKCELNQGVWLAMTVTSIFKGPIVGG